MDKYQATIHDPISLHKYLYANANPVMNSDPTGYFTLSELNTAMSMQSTIMGMQSTYMLGLLSGFLSMTYTALSGGGPSDMLESFFTGMVSGFIFGGLHQLGQAYKVIRGLMAISSLGSIGMGYYQAVQDFEDGKTGAGAFLLTLSTIGALSWVRQYGGDITGAFEKLGGNKGTSKSPNKIDGLVKEIKDWLGKGTKVITNKSGDKVFISSDGTRRIRFDINNTSPHSNPHGHVEQLVGGKWIKSGPLYPVDVPQD